MSAMRQFILPLAAATTLTFSGLSLADGDKVLATVNGKPITQQDYQSYLENNSKGESAGSMNRERVMDEIISRELVLQDALNKGVDKQEAVRRQIETLRTNVILGAALEEAVADNPISDAELKEIYDQQLSNFDVQEYKARHILLEQKGDAEKVITELDMGADFAELAKKRSTGPSGEQGGDLGWFSPQQMVPEFSQQVVKMDKGSYTKSPVKTKFGWHVIKLEDTRSAEPPSFDSVKPKLKQMVEQQRIAGYIQQLRQDAEIDVKK
ncbi:MAG: foldase protein PrsA [Pseudomonadota bacterium]